MLSEATYLKFGTLPFHVTIENVIYVEDYYLFFLD